MKLWNDAAAMSRSTSVVCAALVGLACGQPVPQPPSVILIVLDTVRADHLSLYGYKRDTMPRLASWAETGTVFENAFSAGAWTLPGVGSILTGKYAAQHGAGVSGPSRLHDDVPTLAEILRANGYATGAIANVSFLDPAFGLNRGFEFYAFDPAGDESGTGRADVSVDLALGWLDGRTEPYFFMLHLFDAHRYYDAPEPARGAFTSAYADGYDPETLATLESRVEAERRGDLDFHVAAYDEELLWLDMQIDRFLTVLAGQGSLDNSLVLLTADHGEAFREHHSIGHGGCLHSEIMRVPLVLWEPGRGGRGRSAVPVSTVDILPTVLEYAAVEPLEGAGISLRGVLHGEKPEPRAIFAQNRFYSTDLTALIQWPLKLIQDHKHQFRMLYDLQGDPGETRNMWDPGDPTVVRIVNSMRREVRAIRQGRAGRDVEMSPEGVERLRALGYVQ